MPVALIQIRHLSIQMFVMDSLVKNPIVEKRMNKPGLAKPRLVSRMQTFNLQCAVVGIILREIYFRYRLI